MQRTRRSALVLLLAAAAAGSLAADAVSLAARSDRDRVYLGESFTLYVEVTGVSDAGGLPDLSALAGADAQFVGSQDTSRRSVQIINGRVTREHHVGRVFVFSVKPRAAGPLRAGPVSLEVAGRVYRAAGPAVEVTGVETRTDVLVAVETSGATVLVDDPFRVTLRVAVAALPLPNESFEPLLPAQPPHLQADYLNLAEIRGLKSPDLAALLQGLVVPEGQAPAFTLNDHAARQNGLPSLFNMGFGADPFAPRPIHFRFPPQRVTRDGRAYWEYVLALDYTPQQEGDYVFGPVTFKGPIVTGGDAEGRPLTRNVFTVGPAVTVRVVPPPEAGRPDWFVGSVGTGMLARASFDAAVCKVGDPLTLTLDVTGPVSLANLRAPLLNLQPDASPDFRVYDDNIESEGLPGGKRFRYRVRPLASGTLEFPAIRLAYYDTARRAYVTVLTEPLPVQAHATTQIASADPDAEAGDATLAMQALTVRGSALPCGILMPVGGPAQRLVPAAGGWRPSLAAPPLLWALAWALRAAWRRRQAWASRWRRGHAPAKARAALVAARRRAAADPAAAATAAVQAVRGCLSERLAGGGRALTASDLPPLLRRAGVPDDDAAALHGAFAALERLPFRSGAATPEEAAAAIDRLLAALPEVVRACARHAPRGGRGGSAALLLLLLLACAPPARADAPAELFAWERAHAAMATARTPAEFLDAARLYHGLAAGGIRGGALFYDLGTALLLADDPANAEAAFVRAERYLGGAPDLRANFRLAIARRSGQPDAQLPPSRLLLFWHFGLPAASRARLALSGWCMLWAGLLLRLFTRRAHRPHGAPTATRAFAAFLAGCGLALSLLFCASLGVTWLQERHASRTWLERIPGAGAATPAGDRP